MSSIPMNDMPCISRAAVSVIALAMFAFTLFAASPASASEAPDVPDTPAGKAVHAGIVDIWWNDVPGAESYEAQVLLSDGWMDLPGEGTEIAFYGAGAVVRNLPHEGRYYFRVRARNGAGVSVWSEALFMPATGFPSQWEDVPAPVGVTAVGVPTVRGRLRVSETIVADTSSIRDANGLDRVKFSYQWILNSGTTPVDIEDATGASYTLRPADEGGTIGVRVSFTDRGGYPEGPLASTPMAEVGPVPEVPGAPRNTSAPTGENGKLTLTWEAPASDGGSDIKEYWVEWKYGNEDYDPSRRDMAAGLSHTVIGLLDDVEYTIRVAAVNRIGQGAASVEVTGTPQDTLPPALLSVGVEGATITLTYGEPLATDSAPGPGAFSAKVNGTNRSVSAVSVEGSSASLTLASAAAPGDALLVSYSAPTDTASGVRDTAGNRSPSFQDRAFTYPAEAPGIPRSVTVTVAENGRTTLSWVAPLSDRGSEITGYAVEWKRGRQGYAPSRRQVSDDLSHTISGLTNGVEYTLRVAAINAIGTGEPSEEITATLRDTLAPRSCERGCA